MIANLFNKIVKTTTTPVVALMPRGAIQPTPVPCAGNKLIAGSAGTGVSFFTKYMLATTYAKANVLFLDSTSTFWRPPSEPLLDWPYPMASYKVTADQTSPTELPLIDFGSPLQSGISAVSIDLHYDEHVDIWFSTVERYVAYWQSLVTTSTSNPLQILVLDRFWTYLLKSNGLRGLALLNHLLKTTKEKNAEVWLLSDGDLYDQDLDSLSIFRSVIVSLDQVYLLGQGRYLHRKGQRIQYLHELTSEDLEQLGTLNQNNNPRLGPYREVFVAGNLSARSFYEIYGVVAGDEVKAVIA